MGGSLHTTRQDVEHSSHQATYNQFLPSAYSESSQAKNSADGTYPELYESENSSSGIIHSQKLPSSPTSSLNESCRCPTLVPMDDFTKNEFQSVRTTGDPELFDEKSCSEPESAAANRSSLSLFRGMELVNRTGSLCGREESSNSTQTVFNSNQKKNSSVVSVENTEEGPSGVCPVSADPEPVSPDPEPASAFSFLNS